MLIKKVLYKKGDLNQDKYIALLQKYRFLQNL